MVVNIADLFLLTVQGKVGPEARKHSAEATGGWRTEGMFLPREAARETATRRQHQRLRLHLHGTENSGCHSQLGSEGPSEGPVTASGPR